MRYLLLALFLTGCKTLPVHDTARLTANIGNARSGVESARTASDSIAGNVRRARTAQERSDAKTILVLKWLKEQP